MNIYLKLDLNTKQNLEFNSMSFIPLESVLKSITKKRNALYNKCPAFTDYYKNCFLVRAPYDIEIEVKKNNEGIRYFDLKNQNQEFCNSYILDRNKENSLFSMMSIECGHTFYSEKNVMIEQLTPNLHVHEAEFLKNVMLIQGTFDISKWYRPVHYSFEIIDDNKSINIKRGDPLFYVRFLTDKKVNLIYESENLHVDKIQKACTSVKMFSKQNTMDQNYNIAHNMITNLKNKIFKKSKCPFWFLHKKGE